MTNRLTPAEMLDALHATPHAPESVEYDDRAEDLRDREWACDGDADKAEARDTEWREGR